MAELVELRKERMLPELEQMKRIQLFDDQEIKNIIKERDLHSYRIQRLTKSLKDYLQFIKFEKNLVSLIRERRRSKHIPQKKANIELAVLNRIKILYRQTVQRFPENIQVWDEYIQFCKVYKFGSEVSSILDKMLQFHADKPETWQKAVMWEHEEAKNKERVKHFILGGLQRHPKSDILYFTFIKLKLLEAQQLEDAISRDKVVALVELIYKDGRENIDTVEFCGGALEIVSQFDFARTLEAKILTDMKTSFRDKELMWHILAKRELMGRKLTQISADTDVKTESVDAEKSFELSKTVYETACQLLDTETMWAFYLNSLFDWVESSEGKGEPLRKAFTEAVQKERVSEEVFMRFFEVIIGQEETIFQGDDMLEILTAATKQFPASVPFWELKMRFQIDSGSAEEVLKVFKSAQKSCPAKETFPLWELLILFYKSDDQFAKKVVGVYREAIALSIPEISNPLKPQFIEHLLQTEGIASARVEYNKLCLVVPSSLELHQMMARLERMQERPNVVAWRKCHEMATQFFGKENVDVWLDLIRFEKDSGDAKRVSQLYQRAMSSLYPELVGTFITAFNMAANRKVD